MQGLKLRPALALLSTLVLASPLQASVCPGYSAGYNADDYMSARDSVPEKMGWMQGSPPPEDKRIKLSDGSFFRFPALRYSTAHMSEFLPTTLVKRRNTPVQPLPYELNESIDALQVIPMGAAAPISWEESLWHTYTDGIIVLHQGKVVYERYLGGFNDYDRHAVMSVTKSLTGTLALDLVHQGLLDESRTVSHYIPELEGSGFGDATVKQLLNMTTNIDFDEDFSNPDSGIWAFSTAGNPLPKPKGYTGPTGYLEYLPSVQKAGEHGQRFSYRTANTEVVGWLVARVTGMSVADYLEEKIWSRIGMEQDAQFQVDERGTPFSGGGLNASLRDLARFAELLRNGGKYQGEQILHPDLVPDIMRGNSLAAFESPLHESMSSWSYRGMWWVTGDANKSFMARGVYGQNIYIDPTNDVVIVRLASHPVAANRANDCVTLPAYQRISEFLTEQNHH
ncbi:serine hydrolase domain-containing protein [Marinobacterium sedimentorum]|uniref:serine hydrolase domain-containing protein n=1 Tax=Marinobacterium sedimentorum TaxID=2927804 RepID=UPI0020C70323|nr:serine hydrolase [Marinobacterium sedimentorum]MCP8690428.1 beta-lactamase family protein [Marinobacterium sedimentorum]